MGLRIQNNVEAFNAHRNLTGVASNAAKAMEKLSSGYRINRAADDAAGLAISEKMRAQIGGLDQAQRRAREEARKRRRRAVSGAPQDPSPEGSGRLDVRG